jgi:hypothetical protein
MLVPDCPGHLSKEAIWAAVALPYISLQDNMIEYKKGSYVHTFQTLSVSKNLWSSMLHNTYWTCLQVLESSNDQDHADENVGCRGIAASEEDVDDDSNEVRLNVSQSAMVWHKSRCTHRLHPRGLK